jgi:hypothetical protein
MPTRAPQAPSRQAFPQHYDFAANANAARSSPLQEIGFVSPTTEAAAPAPDLIRRALVIGFFPKMPGPTRQTTQFRPRNSGLHREAKNDQPGTNRREKQRSYRRLLAAIKNFIAFHHCRSLHRSHPVSTHRPHHAYRKLGSFRQQPKRLPQDPTGPTQVPGNWLLPQNAETPISVAVAPLAATIAFGAAVSAAQRAGRRKNRVSIEKDPTMVS